MIPDPLLIELHYLPPIDVLVYAESKGVLLLEACEHYQKGSYRNKAYILSPNDYQLLTVPLQAGKNNRTSICEVQISYDAPWVDYHLRAVEVAYGSAPFFDYYFPEFQSILECQFSTLWTLNYALLSWLRNRLEMSFQIEETIAWERYPLGDDKRSVVKAHQPELLSVLHVDYHPYSQVYEDRFGFRKFSSSLDLLMNVGPESRLYLKL